LIWGVTEDSDLGVHAWPFFAEFDEVIGFHSLSEFQQCEIIFDDLPHSILPRIEVSLDLVGYALCFVGCEIEFDVLVLWASLIVIDIMCAGEHKVLRNEQSWAPAYGLVLPPSQ